jgi:hypothetical protein
MGVPLAGINILILSQITTCVGKHASDSVRTWRSSTPHLNEILKIVDNRRVVVHLRARAAGQRGGNSIAGPRFRFGHRARFYAFSTPIDSRFPTNSLIRSNQLAYSSW